MASDSIPTKSDRSAEPHTNEPWLYRWIFAIGIAMILFGILLFALRAALISLVTIVIGTSLFTTWLYLSTKSRQEQRIPVKDGFPNDQVRIKSDEACICPICKHKVSNTCLNENCACCILMKDNSVVGHSNNPLQ
jgi:hypothetical protein